MNETLNQIGRLFQLEGQPVAYQSVAGGRINATYRVEFHQTDGRVRRYIFQRINTEVFPDPATVMRNIAQVTDHIRTHSPQERTLCFHHTASGEGFVRTADGACWRVMDDIDSAPLFAADSVELAAAVGSAFGRFQYLLADFDATRLSETIAAFHDTPKRIRTLFVHADEDPLGRAGNIGQELAYIRAVSEKASALCVRYAQGGIPCRVTHNDTKAANVLFERDTRTPVVIDLDTVMAGMAVYDFGDGARSVAQTDGRMDSVKFCAYTKGFLSGAAGCLTREETGAFVLGTFSVTVELAVRYLDDYLTGDYYFAPHSSTHNLARARSLITLAQDIAEQEAALTQIVHAAEMACL